MMLGANVSFSDWWVWNQIPVTFGNFIGGFVFTGLFLYWTYRPAREAASPPLSATVPLAVASAQGPAGVLKIP